MYEMSFKKKKKNPPWKTSVRNTTLVGDLFVGVDIFQGVGREIQVFVS